MPSIILCFILNKNQINFICFFSIYVKQNSAKYLKNEILLKNVYNLYYQIFNIFNNITMCTFF